ncbi:recombinase family protein [Legionella longbeachae]|uniref:Site-specific DNA recombinase e14 prophage n=1 Tax=Legionella longbeachae serogroup 1 (strain NSW150) TaxID=661367 RepID=D3HTV0_LEGLN|nr:recombinase family protein [Legionella longbeachae]QIN34167.1 helix-turn-helix domain-containing protein [Legionella longbeachae]CBJ13958.1 site-specific DNA recombinase; e14 prophage [Legionella longbeachae NSW150]HBD7399133.1 recombinase family protein [Legionella pneumophila]
MLIGYARVSTDDQNLNLQHDALKNAGCERIFDDQMTGSKIQRPGLDATLQFARSGDVIVVWRLDRLSRSLKDLIEMVALLDSKKIGLRSLHESIDTSSSSGKLIFHIFGALAEFERNLIRERTHAGLQAARARGRKGGRPKKLSMDKAKLAIEIYNQKNHSIKQICNLMGISKPTLYKYIKLSKQLIW